MLRKELSCRGGGRYNFDKKTYELIRDVKKEKQQAMLPKDKSENGEISCWLLEKLPRGKYMFIR